jgi:hypothetical protein
MGSGKAGELPLDTILADVAVAFYQVASGRFKSGAMHALC